MKTSVLPSVRVDSCLRNKVENALYPSETLSDFIAAAVKTEIIRRQNKHAFITKGLASRDSALETKTYYDAADELDKMYELKTNR